MPNNAAMALLQDAGTGLPRSYIPNIAPLVCLVLYINLGARDEAHRVDQTTRLFDCYHDETCMAQLMDLLKSDDDGYACYMAAVDAAKKGIIEAYDPDFDTMPYNERESAHIQEFYVVSFLEWAKSSGYSVPAYVYADMGYSMEAYYVRKEDRDIDKKNFPAITNQEFERLLHEPLWTISNALLYLFGYKCMQEDNKNIRFIKRNKRMMALYQYISDACKTKELILYDNTCENDGNLDQNILFKCKVQPSKMVEWARQLPMEIPMLKDAGAHARPLSDRERSSLLQIIIAMAIGGVCTRSACQED